jgi:hypothetical protein
MLASTHIRTKIDVKAARKPTFLIVEVAKIDREKLYVLARFDPETYLSTLLGWEWGRVLVRSEPRRFFFPSGPMNYWAEKLHEIDDLHLRRVDMIEPRSVEETLERCGTVTSDLSHIGTAG